MLRAARQSELDEAQRHALGAWRAIVPLEEDGDEAAKTLGRQGLTSSWPFAATAPSGDPEKPDGTLVKEVTEEEFAALLKRGGPDSLLSEKLNAERDYRSCSTDGHSRADRYGCRHCPAPQSAFGSTTARARTN